MSRIKICGLSRMEDIRAVNEEKPDYIGFVFAESRRQVDMEQAWRLKRALSPEIAAVGVFVNAPPEQVMDPVRAGLIDLIQLHGDETAEYMEALREKTTLPIIKAVRVRERGDIEAAQELPCDYLLLDTYARGQYGGSGASFDWSLIPKLRKPFFLAGGIDLSNLREALGTEAFCLDLSSAAETEGRKDPEKIRAFVRMVRDGKTKKGDGANQLSGHCSGDRQ